MYLPNGVGSSIALLAGLLLSAVVLDASATTASEPTPERSLTVHIRPQSPTVDFGDARLVVSAGDEVLFSELLGSDGDSSRLREVLSFRAPVDQALRVVVEDGEDSGLDRAAKARGWWSPTIEIEAGSTDPSVELRVFRRASLRGRLVFPRNVDVASTFRLELSETASKGEAPEDADARLEREVTVCPVADDGSWECPVPATALDLRVHAVDWAPEFFWDVELRAGKALDLGRIELRRGSTVIGRLATASAALGALPQDLRIHLTPPAPRPDESKERLDRLRRRDLRGEIGEDGFLQVSGVPKGGYRLTVEPSPWVVVDSRPVAVGAEPVVDLGEVVLDQTLDFAVQLSPPVDAAGRNWEVTLALLPNGGSGVIISTLSSIAGEDGAAVFDDLAPGTYSLAVRDRDGSSWLREAIEVASDEDVLWRDLALVEVEGSVRGAEDQWPLTIWFGGRNGSPGVRLDTDDRGRFEGYLPRLGEWLLDWAPLGEEVAVRSLEAVEVEKPSAGGAARVVLEIPDTRVSGVVVDDVGQPVPGAIVLAMHLDRFRREAFQYSDVEGRFSLDYLTPGAISVQAELGSRSSDQVTFQIQEDVPVPEIELRIASRRQLLGRVISSDGPVAGALVRATPVSSGGLIGGPGGSPGTAREATATSGADGNFELELPASAKHLRVAVFPLGFTARFFIADVRAETSFLEIPVETDGGTLILELGSFRGSFRGSFQGASQSTSQGTEAGRYVDYVQYDEMMISISELLDWRRLRGAASASEGSAGEGDGGVEISNLQAGNYRYCRVDIGDGEGSSVGSPPVCAEGYLGPGLQLFLSPAGGDDSTISIDGG